MTEFKSHGDVRMKYLVEVQHSDRSRMGQSFSNRREGGESLVDLQKYMGFPGGSDSKEPTHNAGDLGWKIGEGNGYPLQYFCLEKSTDRGAWRATVHGVTKILSVETGDFIRSC